MRKLISTCLVLFAMVLTGCNGSGSGLKDFPSTNDFVIDSDLIDANFEIEEQKIVTLAKKPKSTAKNIDFNQDRITANYSSNGLLVVRNADGYIGFYSLLTGEYLLNSQFVPDWFQYNVITNSYIGFFLKIRNNDTYYVYDGFGNALYQGTNDINSCSTTMIGTTVFATVTDTRSASHYFKYSGTGLATTVSSLPSQVVEESEDEEEYEGPSYGEIFDESWVDLTGYGLPGYFLASNDNGNYTTYYNKEPITSFYVDKSISSPLGIVGENFVYQTKLVVPEDENEYDYFDVTSKTKYSLETVLVDLKTGKKEYKRYAAVLSYIYPLKTKSGEVQNYIVVYQRINDSHILAEYNTKVIDKNFATHDDVSGFEPQAFKKLSENRYFNLITNILYDGNLKPITYLGKMNPVYVPSLKLFRGTLDGKIGFVDLDGKVATEFRYDYLYTQDFAGEHIIALSGGDYYRLNPKFNSATLIGKDVSRIGENLFMLSNNNEIQLFSSDDTILTTRGRSNFVTHQLSYLGANKAYFFSGSNGMQSGDLIFNTVVYEGFAPKTIDSSVRGNEKSGTIYSGSSYNYAQSLALGSNSIHGLRTTYLKYKPTRIGYYSFYFDNETTYLNYLYKGESSDNRTSVQYNSESFTSYKEIKYTALLEANTTYVLQIAYSGSKQLTSVYVEMETGTNSNYPYYASLSSSDTNQLSIARHGYSASKFYVNVIGNEKKKYTISIPSLTGYTVTYNGRDVTSGINIANGVTKQLIITLPSAITSAKAFTITKSAPGIDEGYGDTVPLDLQYGSNSNITSTSGFGFDYDGGLYSYGYVAFTASHVGMYSVSFTYYTSSTYYTPTSSTLYKVSSTGTKTSLTTSTSSSISYNNVLLEEKESILLKFNLSTSGKKTYFSAASISATQGYAYENPIALSGNASSTLSASGVAYYTITSSTNEKLLSIVSTSTTLSFKKMVDGSATTSLSKGSNTIAASEKTTYIFIRNTSTSASATFTLTLFNATIELEKTYAYSYYDSYGTEYYAYVNSGTEAKTVYLSYSMQSTYTYVAQLYYGIDSAIDSLTQVNITPASGGALKFDVPAKSTLIIGFYFTYSYPINFVLSETQPNYAVNFKSSDSYLSFNQKYTNSNYEYYSPSTSYGTAEMSITAIKAGSLSFAYKSYGYNSSNDYLLVLVNGETVLTRKGSSSSSYLSYTINDLKANDVVTFRWVKGSSSTSTSYYGAIRNISFTPANA